MNHTPPWIEYIKNRPSDEVIERDEVIETQRAVIADLQSQVAALQAHHRNMREHWQRLYATVIVRALKAEREAAKWEGIAKGMIEEVTE